MNKMMKKQMEMYKIEKDFYNFLKEFSLHFSINALKDLHFFNPKLFKRKIKKFVKKKLIQSTFNEEFISISNPEQNFPNPNNFPDIYDTFYDYDSENNIITFGIICKNISGKSIKIQASLESLDRFIEYRRLIFDDMFDIIKYNVYFKKDFEIDFGLCEDTIIVNLNERYIKKTLSLEGICKRGEEETKRQIENLQDVIHRLELEQLNLRYRCNKYLVDSTETLVDLENKNITINFK